MDKGNLLQSLSNHPWVKDWQTLEGNIGYWWRKNEFWLRLFYNKSLIKIFRIHGIPHLLWKAQPHSKQIRDIYRLNKNKIIQFRKNKTGKIQPQLSWESVMRILDRYLWTRSGAHIVSVWSQDVLAISWMQVWRHDQTFMTLPQVKYINQRNSIIHRWESLTSKLFLCSG